jgi:hypothetical protein
MTSPAIASMLANTGANIGSSIGGGIKGLGTGIGGMLQSRADAKNKQAMEAQVQEELQKYANDPAQLNAMGQKYQSMGKNDIAKAFYEAAKQATAKQDKSTQATTGRGKGELMALANNPRFDIENQKMQAGYFGMADSFGVSREEAMQIALDAKKGREGGGKVSSSRSAGQYKDSKGNFYERSIVRTDRGEEGRWLPITPGAPATPQGKVTPVGGAYKETAGEKTERDVITAGDTTESEEFARLRIEAVDSLPQIEGTILSTERSLQVLETIKTGGWSTAAVRSASRFLGVEPKSEAEFNLLAGQQVLNGLSNFEGAISEGERNYLQSLYQDLARSNGANRGILELMLDTANRALRDAETRANSSTFQEYMENRQDYREPLGEPNQRVNFNDLKRGS